MAKYEVKFSCGHTQTVELLGKTKDRYRKIEWYEESGLCTECYKKHMEEEANKMPLILNIGLEVYGHRDAPFVFSFSGNTKPVKDEIKSLNYHWGDRPGGAFSILSVKADYSWYKYVSFDEFEAEMQRVQERFPAVKFERSFSDFDISAYRHFVDAENQKKAALKAEIAQIEKPHAPECYPEGKWNGKVYGSSSRGYSIYIDGEKVDISAENKKSLEEYQAKMEAYKKQVNTIKQKYD